MSFDWPPKTATFNTKGFPQAHHVIEHASETKRRTVRICRCWQSKKFPYCDDSHKLLMEHGDSVGPFIAEIDSLRSDVNKNTATMTDNAKTANRAVGGMTLLKRVHGIPGKIAFGLICASTGIAAMIHLGANDLLLS